MASRPFQPRLTRQSAADGIDALARKIDENLLALHAYSGGVASSIRNVENIVANFNGGAGPWLNGAVQYVSPQGNDNASGLGWDTAKKTVYEAYKVISAAGSGILYFADMAEVGGPVLGQGLWLRDDGLSVNGFLRAVPSVIIGYGGAPQSFQSEPGAARLICGSNAPSDHRTKPGIWLCCNDNSIVTFYGVVPVAAVGDGGNAKRLDRLLTPWRLGWDYPRDYTSAGCPPAYLQITAAVRSSGSTGSNLSWTPGSTTFTVTLPAGIPVASASRTGTQVTLSIPQPVAFNSKPVVPPYNAGGQVWFESADPTHYPSGAYTIILAQFGLDPTYQWGFSYVDAGAPALTVANPGVVRSPQLLPKEYLDLESTDPNFPSGQYRVTAVSITSSTTAQITVADYWGGHNGVPSTATGGAIGKLVKQERGLAYTLAPRVVNCQGTIPEDDATALYRSGPTFDWGGINAGSGVMDHCLVAGYTPTPTSGVPWDEDRMAAIFGYGGTMGFSNLFQSQLIGTQLETRFICAPNSRITIDYRVADTDSGYPPPAYHITSATQCRINIVNAEGADAVPGWQYDPIIDGVFDPLLITGSALPSNISVYGPQTKAIGFTDGWKNGQYPRTPWAMDQIAHYGKMRVTGRHAASHRGGALAVPRFANLVGDPSVWVYSGPAPTIGVPDPFGGNKAVRVHDGTDDLLIEAFEHMTFFAPGGRFVVAGWINLHSIAANNGTQIGVHFVGRGRFSPLPSTDLVWSDTGTADWFEPLDVGATGWQFMVAWRDLVSGSANQYCDIVLRGPASGSGSDVDYYGFTAFWVPPGFYENDIAEYLGTLRSQPIALSPGHAGTMEGVRVIGHGGIGVDSSVLLTPSGTAAQTKNIPIYGADGTTVIAWVPAVEGNAALNVAGDHKVLATHTDPTADYISNKIVSQNGTLTVGAISGGSLLSLDAKPMASLHYDWAISAAPFTSYSGFLYTSSQSNYAAGGGAYPLGVAAGKVRLLVNVITNSLTGGAGNWTLTVYRNGVATGASLTFNSGTTGKQSVTISGVGGADTDDYALFFTTGGGLTGGAIEISASILVTAG